MSDVLWSSEPNADAEMVVARFRWTVEELRNTYRNHYRYLVNPWTRFCVILAATVCLLVSAFVFAIQDASGPVAGVILLSGALLAFAIFSRHLTISRYWARSQFRRRPDQNIELEFRFTPDGIRSQSTLGEGRTSWSAFIKAVTTPEGLLLYSLENFWHWLPRHAFSSEADFEQVIAWAEQKVPVHRRG
jgi:hypothetical protein